jgi:hypothetical protein
MTYLLAMLALTSAWIHNITPESSIQPYHRLSTPVSLCVCLSFVYQFLSIHYWMQHCCEGYSAAPGQMNTWKVSEAYDNTCSTANLAAASRYPREFWIYVFPSCGYTTFGDLWFSLIDNKLSMTWCNAAVTHWDRKILDAAPILCHAITSITSAFTHDFFV